MLYVAALLAILIVGTVLNRLLSDKPKRPSQNSRSEPLYVGGEINDASGKPVAVTFCRPHTNIWGAMAELANSSKKAPQP